MSEHEFYADPTLFDRWQRCAAGWLCTTGDRIRPYAWVLGFSALGAALMSISATIFGVQVYNAAAHLAAPWNQSMVQGITVVVALAAAQALFRQALETWPADRAIPEQIRHVARYVGWQPPPGTTGADRLPSSPQKISAASAVNQDRIQAFFAGVRAAGVNVTIARSLFAAGIRSPERLRGASDHELAAIRGVGPATVRKLRAQFG